MENKIIKIKRWFENKSEEALAYLLAIVALLIAALAEKFGFSDVALILVLISQVLMVYGLLAFLTPKVLAFWHSLLGKIFFTVVIFIGSTLCLSIGESIVNYSLEVPSSAFVHTKSIAAILVAPLLILVGIIATLVILFIIAIPLFMFGDVKLSIKGIYAFVFNPKKNKAQEIGLLRVVALVILISVCMIALEKSKDYQKFVTDAVRWYAFNFEAEKHSYCMLGDEERVAYLSSELIIVAAKNQQGGYEFKVVNCDRDLR